MRAGLLLATLLGLAAFAAGPRVDVASAALSVNNVTVNEAAGMATFTVTHPPVACGFWPFPACTSFTYATSSPFGYTAVPGLDYVAVSGMRTFAAAQAAEDVDVPLINDALDEYNETFQFAISSTSEPVIDGIGVGTIVDNDPLPGLSVSNATVSEAGGVATFTVHLTPVSGRPVTVDYATADGTATAPADYTATSGSLVFWPGETAKLVNVPVVNNSVDQTSRGFTLHLSGAVNGFISDPTGVGTIIDDDGTPQMSIADQALDEGSSGTTQAVVTVSLSAPSGLPVSVHYTTADGTATAPGDYDSSTGTVSFAVGETAKTISIPVAGDTAVEPDETFAVDLSSPVNATLARSGAVVTIRNDDVAPPPPPSSEATTTLPPPVVTQSVTASSVDLVPPSVTVSSTTRRLRVALSQGVRLKVKQSEPGQVCAALTLGLNGAQRFGLRPTSAEKRSGIVQLGARCVAFDKAGTSVLAVRFTPRARRAALRLVQARRTLSLLVAIAAFDRAGNRHTTTLRLSLGR